MIIPRDIKEMVLALELPRERWHRVDPFWLDGSVKVYLDPNQLADIYNRIEKALEDD